MYNTGVLYLLAVCVSRILVRYPKGYEGPDVEREEAKMAATLSSTSDWYEDQAEETPPEEPHALCCPITHSLYRDPVFVPESGNTYEREAIVNFWKQAGPTRDALTNASLSSDQVFTNWDKRGEVQAFLEQHPGCALFLIYVFARGS